MFSPPTRSGVPGGAGSFRSCRCSWGITGLEKTRYSAFAGTKLDEVLKQEQVEQVAVVGVCTSICVLETIKELFDRDIPTLVYRDGVADFDPEAHAFALKHLERISGRRWNSAHWTDRRR